MNATLRRKARAAVSMMVLMTAGTGGTALAQTLGTDDLAVVGQDSPGVREPCDEPIQNRLFLPIFVCGDELFETPFNAVDGVGANIGNGQRFTRVPRFDLPGYSIQPVQRTTGPSAQTCATCHPGAALGGAGDGSGPLALNNIQDRVGPTGLGRASNLITRNPPHLFAPGAVQVLAEEMTEELHAARTSAINRACASRTPIEAPIRAKGVSFGSIRVTPVDDGTCLTRSQVDTSSVQGVDSDLVVRPFGLDGIVASLRTFSAGAFHNELGMEPVEFAGRNVDNDGDGVVNEISIADVTAMTVYLAAQPMPQTLLRLDALRQELQQTPEGREQAAELPLPVLSAADRAQIRRGEQVFGEIGCADCHRPSLTLLDRRFREPSRNPAFRQPGDRSPAGIDLIDAGVDPAQPISFDLVMDPPDNQFVVNGELQRLGGLPLNDQNRAVVPLFGDLKRHDMGSQNAEELPRLSEIGQMQPGSVFMTAELWGVGSTAPYLHDGSATTISEAVLFGHGGEASAARDGFRQLSDGSRADLLSFLNNLVLFFPAEEEDE